MDETPNEGEKKDAKIKEAQWLTIKEERTPGPSQGDPIPFCIKVEPTFRRTVMVSDLVEVKEEIEADDPLWQVKEECTPSRGDQMMEPVKTELADSNLQEGNSLVNMEDISDVKDFDCDLEEPLFIPVKEEPNYGGSSDRDSMGASCGSNDGTVNSHLPEVDLECEQPSSIIHQSLSIASSSASQASVSSINLPPFKRRKTKSNVTQNVLLSLACYYLSRGKDFDTPEVALGKVWASKLKSLEPVQRIFAEKAINDIIFEAQLERLHEDSVKINMVGDQQEQPEQHSYIYNPGTGTFD